MTRPTVAVVMPIYNGGTYLAEALASLRAQTLLPDEIVVVDDGSTDGSGALAAARAPQARLVRQENAGVAAALARGVRETTAEIVTFLEADDVWLPEKLAREAARFAAEPDVAWTLCHTQIFLDAGCERPSWLRPALLDGPSLVAFVSALAIRRTVFARVGDFDATYRYGQDTEWMMRAQAAGMRRAILPEVSVRRRIHASNMTDVQRHATAMLRVARAAARRHAGAS
ncbi:MAG: glycosyltransferase family 2 protein [bacterium]|nr:glycosyltransferase family 2 protein [bacterium]